MKFGRWICAIKRIPFSCLCPFMDTRRDPSFCIRDLSSFENSASHLSQKKPPRFQTKVQKRNLGNVGTKSKGEKLHSITYWIHTYILVCGNVIPAGLANWWDLWSCSSIVPSLSAERKWGLAGGMEYPMTSFYMYVFGSHISWGSWAMLLVLRSDMSPKQMLLSSALLSVCGEQLAIVLS